MPDCTTTCTSRSRQRTFTYLVLSVFHLPWSRRDILQKLGGVCSVSGDDCTAGRCTPGLLVSPKTHESSCVQSSHFVVIGRHQARNRYRGDPKRNVKEGDVVGRARLRWLISNTLCYYKPGRAELQLANFYEVGKVSRATGTKGPQIFVLSEKQLMPIIGHRVPSQNVGHVLYSVHHRLPAPTVHTCAV